MPAPLSENEIPPARQNRWKTGFRIILAIPAILFGAALIGSAGARSNGYNISLGVAVAAAFVGWFAILARGWGSVFTVGLTIASIVYGPMLGAFLLGVLTRSANQTGVMAGIAVSLAAMIAVHQFTPLAWTWYVLTGTSVCVAVGLAVSRVSR